MKITGMKIEKVQIPLKEPFKVAFATVSSHHDHHRHQLRLCNRTGHAARCNRSGLRLDQRGQAV